MGTAAHLTPQHRTVLLSEAVMWLAPFPGGRYLDATVGAGGHATAILEAAAPDGVVLGFDRDPYALQYAAARLSRFGARVTLLHTGYDRLTDMAQQADFLPVDGVLFDLGFSSLQVDDSQRGFAFRLNGPLDMRYDPDSDDPSAAELLNTLDEAELTALLRLYGEEPHSRRIAHAIVAARPLHTTRQLAEVVAQASGGRYGGIHPATRTFQALRIAVNRELERLEATLPQAVAALRPGGRLVVITFHSLEDRIVKHFLREQARDCICPPRAPICVCEHQPALRLLFTKAIAPSATEIAENPRSRSARLRAAEKII